VTLVIILCAAALGLVAPVLWQFVIYSPCEDTYGTACDKWRLLEYLVPFFPFSIMFIGFSEVRGFFDPWGPTTTIITAVLNMFLYAAVAFVVVSIVNLVRSICALSDSDRTAR
jgi:uncharacterized metal-binding protein